MNDPMELDAQTAIAEAMAKQLSDDPEQRALITEGYRMFLDRGRHDSNTCPSCRVQNSPYRYLSLDEDDGSETVIDLYRLTQGAVSLRIYSSSLLVFTERAQTTAVPEFQGGCQYQQVDGVCCFRGEAAKILMNFMGRKFRSA